MPTTKQRTSNDDHQLREALAPYLDLRKLRKLAAAGGDLQHAFHHDVPTAVPPEVTALLTALCAILRPSSRESITTPAEIAALLMVELAGRDQEELWTVLLDTKNHVIDLVTVYRGTLNSAPVRVAEVFKEAIRRNAASIIVAHNHPSSDPTPSPEDQALTLELIQAGKLLGVEMLDHLVIGKGVWTSLRQRNSWQ